MAEPYSIWLIPEPKAQAYFALKINELCALEKVPSFYPHVTLISSQYEDFEQTKKKVTEAIFKFRPLKLQVQSLAQSAYFFKTFYVDLVLSTRLNDWFHHIRQAVDPDSKYELKPHLSLLYKEMTEAERLALFPSMPIPMREITFDQIAIVRPLDKERGWHAIDSWEVTPLN